MNNSFWARLNLATNTRDGATDTDDADYSEVQCSTKGDKITKWNDARQEPTSTQIKNVTQTQIDNFYIDHPPIDIVSLINHLEDNGVPRHADAPPRKS